MRKILFSMLLMVLSFSLFAGGEIQVSFSATGSGMSVSITGVSGGKKQVNVYKTTSGNNNSGSYLTQFSVSNGSAQKSIDSVKCGEQIFVKVLQADKSDLDKASSANRDGIHWVSNVSKLRKNYSGSNCGKVIDDGRGDRNSDVRIIDSARISSCGYGAEIFLKKKGSQYTVAFNDEARSRCNKVYFESAGKTYYLSNGLDFTPSNSSLEEARSYSGMKISIYSKSQSYYAVETVYLKLR